MPVSQTLTVPRVVLIKMVGPVGSTENKDTGCCAAMRASGNGKYKPITLGKDGCLVYLTLAVVVHHQTVIDVHRPSIAVIIPPSQGRGVYIVIVTFPPKGTASRLECCINHGMAGANV
jgi:hypothetical protein